MPSFPNYNEFAFSFSHATIKVNDRQFMGVDGVRIAQGLQDAPVYGTSRTPLKRSAGQVQMGAGMLRFSDFEDGIDFFRFLAPDPYMRIWDLDYVLMLESGTVRSVACRSCRLLDFSMDHSAGPDAVGIEYPFSFLSMKVDGLDIVLSPQALLQAGIGVAQNLLNLI